MPADAFDFTAAPLRVGLVRLRVRDLAGVAAFYRNVVGLHPLGASGDTVVLGTPATPLLELLGDESATPREPRAAGLFHTAFLLPGRAHLARWLAHAIALRVPLQGASDHLVSEAIYLSDPEGNGIEIYADRPPSTWRGPDGAIRMASDPLDMQDLLAEAGIARWSGFPDGGMVGHVHLQVGDPAEAERFYAGVLGFDIAARFPGASFFGSGGYHHQLAGNAWNSRGARRRPAAMAGLDSVVLHPRDPGVRAAILAAALQDGIQAGDDGRTVRLSDPWGTAIEIAP